MIEFSGALFPLVAGLAGYMGWKRSALSSSAVYLIGLISLIIIQLATSQVDDTHLFLVLIIGLIGPILVYSVLFLGILHESERIDAV